MKVMIRPITSNSTKLHIVTSFYPLYFFTAHIAGDKAEVVNITPAGAEPHDYEANSQDIVKIENSQLVVLNGNGLEGWGNKIKQILQNSKTKIIEVSGSGESDPHVWLSPRLAKDEAVKIAAAMVMIDPVNKDYYQQNLANLSQELEALDAEYRQGLANCQLKDFVTSHEAFGYLAKEYGLEQIAITGVSPDSEPSVQKLTEITQLVKSKGVEIIFFESLVNPKLSETVAAEVGAKTMVLNPIEGITSEEQKSGKNYFNLMRTNLTNLRIALKCQ